MKWAPDEVQADSGGQLPEGLAMVKVTSQEEVYGKTNGTYGILVQTRVTDFYINGVEHPEHKHRPFKFSFYIGTEGDRKAEKRETWAKSGFAKKYKAYLQAAKIPMGDTEEECANAPGAELSIQIGSEYSDDRDGRTDANGNIIKYRFARADQFIPLGDVKASEHTRANGLDKVAPVVAVRAPKAAPIVYVDDDDTPY